MELLFLGTGSMMPTKERGHVAVLLTHGSEGILVDCGEGTQRQFRLADTTPTRITKILISHWHGDHVLGLPGIIQSLGASEYSGTLEMYGPKGSAAYFGSMMNGFAHRREIDIKLNEIRPGVFFENKDFILEAARLNHPTNCLGYAFIEKDRRRIDLGYLKRFGLRQHPILKNLQEGRDIVWKGKRISAKKATIIKKGRKIAFISDTTLCDAAIRLARDADVLVCEATHLDELKDKAERYMHLTAKQAAELAKKARAKRLIITHFSQRYKNARVLEKEAKAIFRDTIAAKELMKVSI